MISVRASHIENQRCDDVVKIPLRGKTESLNASVASALAVYQVLSKTV
ncbi:MAG: hypothetical protein JSS75_13705 [Bacteroidetes bacterium]|nr:hypothetical protein [Bacteroidota bacterium]